MLENLWRKGIKHLTPKQEWTIKEIKTVEQERLDIRAYQSDWDWWFIKKLDTYALARNQEKIIEWIDKMEEFNHS